MGGPAPPAVVLRRPNPLIVWNRLDLASIRADEGREICDLKARDTCNVVPTASWCNVKKTTLRVVVTNSLMCFLSQATGSSAVFVTLLTAFERAARSARFAPAASLSCRDVLISLQLQFPLEVGSRHRHRFHGRQPPRSTRRVPPEALMMRDVRCRLVAFSDEPLAAGEVSCRRCTGRSAD